MTAPPASAVEIRRLAYADLPQVVAVERRAFATPWSLAMFVLELSKPSGICLAARPSPHRERGHGGGGRGGRDRDLAGYVICSRYDTAFHVMNVAVDPDRRREGIASALLASLLDRAGPDAQLTLEVRRSNAGAIALYEGFGFRSVGVRRRYYADTGEDALVMWRTPGILRGSLEDIPGL